MSLSARRESLLKSSISIKSMRDSVAKFNKGLNAAKKSAIEIVKNTKESNLLKRTLIMLVIILHMRLDQFIIMVKKNQRVFTVVHQRKI